jgi:hypothetical protein
MKNVVVTLLAVVGLACVGYAVWHWWKMRQENPEGIVNPAPSRGAPIRAATGVRPRDIAPHSR